MIIVKFQGALGNQMFEYAFLKKLQDVYPDTNILGYVGKIKDFNGFELDKVFGIDFKRTTWKQVIRLSNIVPEEAFAYGLMKQFMKINQFRFGYKASHIKQDDNTSFYSGVYELNPLYSYYLDGVWANARYLDGIRDKLIEEFTFKHNLDAENLSLLKRMQSTNSVCIHVRRNEYVTKGLTVTSDKYYKEAISYMCDRIENPQFFVFSDDHEYCEKLFSGMIDYTMVRGNKGENSYKDMQLMTYCKHNIIANSTFSFWGAYLGKNEEKIVTAPNVSWGDMRHSFACEGWKIIDAT